MTSTKISTQVDIKKAIAPSKICISKIYISTICIASVASSLTFIPVAFARYGLGLPKSAGTGGATRGDLPQLTMLGPEDGAKTLAARPTFYWYIAPTTVVTPDSTSASTTLLKLDEGKSSFKVTFFLRDGNERSSKSVFIAEGKADETGLYKFTLPADAPELVTGKVQRWQIRWQASGGVTQVDVNAPIRRDDDPVMLKAIASAKNDLEKARIYTKNTYWYEAIDTYTSWLSQNPKDEVARKERSQLLKEGLKNNTAFSKERQSSLTTLLNKLDEAKSVMSIALQPKVRR